MSNRSSILLALLMVCLAVCTGCNTKAVIPELTSEHIKAVNSVTVYAKNSRAVKTGVHVKKGDFYTLIATGYVGTSRMDRPSSSYPGQGPERKLDVMIDKELQIARPINATLSSPMDGEISLVVFDIGFIHEYGYAKYNRQHYKDNQGSFAVTVIVWNTKNVDHIVAFFNKFKTLNPENEAVDELITQANSLKTAIAEAQFASAPIDEVRQTTKEIITAPHKESNSSDSQKNEVVAAVPAAPLPQQSQRPVKDSDEILDKTIDRYAPLMLLLSPREGQTVSTRTIQLIGVVEDDTALKEVEISINGKPVSLQMHRGIFTNAAELSARFEFNEKISIDTGPNRIDIRVEDIHGRVSKKTISVLREESRGNVWAVVVGVDTYPNVPQLKYAVSDAQAFHDYLVESELVKPENIFRIINDQAKLHTLRSVLGTQLKKQAGSTDMVIIYFAGHGATERDVNSPDGDGLEKYLLPYDADPADLYASALPMREISYILNRIRSNRLVFIADSCYSGASGGRTVRIGGIRSNLSDHYIERIAGGKGRVILTASAANEVSVEDDGLGHGIFTYYLLKGLKGSADYDGDGYVTVDEAYRYVSEEVPKATGQEQHPIKKGSVEGQIVLGIAM